jgi:hypothetical protein
MFRRKQAQQEVAIIKAERKAGSIAMRQQESQHFVDSMANWWTCATPPVQSDVQSINARDMNGDDGPVDKFRSLNIDSNQSQDSNKGNSPKPGAQSSYDRFRAKPKSPRQKTTKQKSKEDSKRDKRIEQQMQAMQTSMQEMRTMLQQIYLMSSQSQSLQETFEGT